jgi:putative FmdB family regulatory protein
LYFTGVLARKSQKYKRFMPIYDYQCRRCGAEFEALRGIRSEDSDVECPVCGEKDAERKVSLTASEILKSFGCGSGRGSSRFG